MATEPLLLVFDAVTPEFIGYVGGAQHPLVVLRQVGGPSGVKVELWFGFDDRTIDRFRIGQKFRIELREIVEDSKLPITNAAVDPQGEGERQCQTCRWWNADAILYDGISPLAEKAKALGWGICACYPVERFGFVVDGTTNTAFSAPDFSCTRWLPSIQLRRNR